MSGGSWDYVCFQVQEAADRLVHSSDPLFLGADASALALAELVEDAKRLRSVLDDQIQRVEAT